MRDLDIGCLSGLMCEVLVYGRLGVDVHNGAGKQPLSPRTHSFHPSGDGQESDPVHIEVE